MIKTIYSFVWRKKEKKTLCGLYFSLFLIFIKNKITTWVAVHWRLNAKVNELNWIDRNTWNLSNVWFSYFWLRFVKLDVPLCSFIFTTISCIKTLKKKTEIDFLKNNNKLVALCKTCLFLQLSMIWLKIKSVTHNQF